MGLKTVKFFLEHYLSDEKGSFIPTSVVLSVSTSPILREARFINL